MIMDYIHKAGLINILAPMVGYSDLAYRILSLRYGAKLCYSEMVHSKVFLDSNSSPLVNRWYTILPPIRFFLNPEISHIICENIETYFFEKNLPYIRKNIHVNDWNRVKTSIEAFIKDQNVDLNGFIHASSNSSESHSKFKKSVFEIIDKIEQNQDFLVNFLFNHGEKDLISNETVHFFDETNLTEDDLKINFRQSSNEKHNTFSISSCILYEIIREYLKPFVVQICGNDPLIMLNCAKKIEPYCEAIDINFGCPQNIAKKGFYGSFLQEDLEKTKEIIETLSRNLKISLFCKIRIMNTLSETLEYARLIERSGAKLLTVHGRTREMKGQKTGVANLEYIQKIKNHLSIPVITNGNVLESRDIPKNLEYTKANGIMVAESHLFNPLIFINCRQNRFYSDDLAFQSISQTILDSQKGDSENSCSSVTHTSSDVTNCCFLHNNILSKKSFDNTRKTGFYTLNDKFSVRIALQYFKLAYISGFEHLKIRPHLFKILFNVLNDETRDKLKHAFELQGIHAFLLEMLERVQNGA